MSAGTQNVQATSLESTFNNKNKYKFIAQKLPDRYKVSMWTKMEPEWQWNGAKIAKENKVFSDKFKIKMASSSSSLSKMQPKSC